MARVAFPLVLQSPSSGSAIVGATATITQHVVGGTLGAGPAATIYTSETGAGVVTGNQIVSDSSGRWTQGSGLGFAQYWLPQNTYDITISGTGLTTYTITRELFSALLSDEVSLAGELKMWAGAAAPSGFLLCDGTAYSRTTYASLFAAIGTAFGAGDGTTTFNVPDMRQRFPLGKATSGTGAVLGGSGGQVDHTHSVPGLSIPSLAVANYGHTHTLSSAAGAAVGFTNNGYTYYAISGANFTANRYSQLLAATGASGSSVNGAALYGSTDSAADSGYTGTGTTGGAATSNQNPPFQTVNYIIRHGLQ